MCGIIGYIGPSPACPILIEGLKKLEYRGYDSAGVAVIHNGTTEIARAEGKIARLEKIIDGAPLRGSLGVGHTRWATHGRPSEQNAHPHKAGKVVVVHNGIIENYSTIKKQLIASGRVFSSETDTEVIAQLIDAKLAGGAAPLDAIMLACRELKGSVAAGILIESDTSALYAVRKESPLVIGVGDDEAFLASDIPAILGRTRRMIYLDDGEIAVLRPDRIECLDFSGAPVRKKIVEVDLNPIAAEKGGFKHFMLKEIFEQSRAVTDTFRGRVSEETGEIFLDELRLADDEIRRIEKIVIIACGTSFHAGLVGRRIIEGLTRIPVEVDLASEFRYRDPIVGPNTLTVGISQSGETADTLAAAKEAAKRGSLICSICNVIESSLARISTQGVIYTHAGPEIGVASTKAFTTQITTLYLLGLLLAWKKGILSSDRRVELIGDLITLPRMIEEALDTSRQLAEMARRFHDYPSFLYLGRGTNTAIAYEGALKLKEISYIHAEAYPGGEMKHGPIALISEEMPVVAVLARDGVFEKMLSNMEEVRSRGGILLAFMAGDEDSKVNEMAEEVVRVPQSNEYLTPILLTVPLQLLAYHIADFKGTDVDQPRNLAKSVTVE
ncbi:MAG: glutamine--fructose-6-phosphate transaminase (isomerizing) [Thermodesulfobacteriota bacterium]